MRVHFVSGVASVWVGGGAGKGGVSPVDLSGPSLADRELGGRSAYLGNG